MTGFLSRTCTGHHRRAGRPEERAEAGRGGRPDGEDQAARGREHQGLHGCREDEPDPPRDPGCLPIYPPAYLAR